MATAEAGGHLHIDYFPEHPYLPDPLGRGPRTHPLGQTGAPRPLTPLRARGQDVHDRAVVTGRIRGAPRPDGPLQERAG
ncbi:hypothetical protein [Streptomyces sp. NPDC001020]